MINLTDKETAALEQIAENGIMPQSQRAKAVLLTAQGKADEEVSVATQLTTRQVHYWLNRYAEHGPTIFGDGAAAEPDKVQRPKRPQLAPQDRMGVLADDPMSEAGRKIMAYHLARLLKEEDNVRDNASDEAVHDMRVATRRLRSVVDIFGPFYHKHVVKALGRELRKVGRLLGAVRDLEVVQKRVQQDAEKNAMSDGLQPLLDEWKDQIESDRKKLIDLLDRDRYADFIDFIVEFVSTPGGDAVARPDPHSPTPFLVRHIAPVLIYQQYEAVRAYEPFLGGASLDTLHALRIEAKRLRYTLEAFEEVLSPDAKRAISATKALQDHLGELQDARIAIGLMQDFVRHADEYKPVTAILQYMAVREEQKQQLLAAVSQSWEAFAHTDIRRALSRSIAAL